MTTANQLAQELAQRIVRYCVDKQVQPGDRLTERKLAAALDVSRSPIRSALKLLEDRKLLQRGDIGYELAVDAKGLDRAMREVTASAEDELFVRILRDRFAGKLGDHVSEADLLRTYDVTRSHLLKALMHLHREGYVARSPGRGWSFLETLRSVEAHRASYEFRLAVEPAALASPNYKIDRAAVERLLERHRKLFAAVEKKKISGAEWFDLDAELHDMLVGFSGNEFFIQAMKTQNRLRRVVEIESFYADERVRESFEEHVQILEALLKPDTTWAATLLARHLQLASESTEVFFTR
jgi:DNA-binding GntR family transcriptional regulator